MRITFWHPPASEHERFKPHAFDSIIGKSIRWTLKETDDGPVIADLGEAILVGAVVDEDGRGARLTIEVEDNNLSSSLESQPDRAMSFGWKTEEVIPDQWWDG
jgi:hypothetical protein